MATLVANPLPETLQQSGGKGADRDKAAELYGIDVDAR
jgi:hypothetical protein